ncbi:hypothetical protein [Fibrobacter sp. UWP2]|uniref:hypothetical protein n=1 Tax=Fibrobacter sp. UWP2 TaxID=1896216 RepID=UPI000916FB82|nr:hypothetical protein [Fibrobacter sp. UWP2]SHI35035.1 hypothetical protein SAMN05720471_101249 [Fibrobacter sp. UWP2]
MAKHVTRIVIYVIVDVLLFIYLLKGDAFKGELFQTLFEIFIIIMVIRGQAYYVLDYLYEWKAYWRETYKEVKELRKEVAGKEDKENLP